MKTSTCAEDCTDSLFTGDFFYFPHSIDMQDPFHFIPRAFARP